jgi:hypothetical protein
MAMVRKQVFITAEQNRRLKQRAAQTGTVEAEVIRAAIDRELGLDTGGEGGWKDRMLAAAAQIEDADGLERRVNQLREGWNRRIGETGRKLRGED